MSTEQTVTMLRESFLRKASKRGSIVFLLMAVVTLAFLLAGVWVDWRWIPTAIIPLIISVTACGISVTASNEITRRAAETTKVPR
jgi:Kef-type K+ transport system membrane component KefB